MFNYKKIQYNNRYSLLLFLAFITTASIFSSCSKPKDTENQDSQKKDEYSLDDVINQTYSIGDPIKFDDRKITVTQIENPYIEPNPFYEPEPGHFCIAVEIEYVNQSDKAIKPNYFDWKISDLEGNTHEQSWSCAQEPILSNEEIAPGKSTKGWITFEVYEGSSGHKLLLNPNWLEEEGKSIAIELQ
ncbi:DUF4352 domain-containing protein [Candidatus Dojkabacteria bacterium]|nr:DUF4352 domain-containing protein [Candidatus Dojkabacteria bacterium]